MDRLIVYPGAIPLDTDLLNVQRNAMIALGYALQAALGSSVVFDGLIATPGTGLAVDVGPGCIVSMGDVDAAAFGSLAADASSLMRIGINRSAMQVALTAPSTAATDQKWLIVAQLCEVDADPVVLPYFNAASPTVPWSGPSGSGGVQPTQRQQSVALRAIAGVPAATGSAAVPAPSSGWVPLYVVSVSSGMTSVPAANITLAAGAPIIPFKLPQLRPGFSEICVYLGPGTFVVPAGVNQVRVRMVGGGGGGGGGSAISGGAGGGAGGYVEAVIAVAPGTAIPIMAGAAGLGSGDSDTSGGNGGTSGFGTYLAATGGLGGIAYPGGSAGGTGGLGYGGAALPSGGGAGMDGQLGALIWAASGGASFFGGGGRGASGGWYAGGPSDASAWGAGGGGAYFTATQGGNGGNGIVVVEW